MANQKSINQGDINDNSIKPTWGTFERQEEYDKEDRFIAIVESISKTVANKSDIGHDHDDRYYTESEIDSDISDIDNDVNQLEGTANALENGIAIISTNNTHPAINQGQYIYIRSHEILAEGLYKATADIAQNAELSDENVISASGALNEKLSLSGGTMTGPITLAESGYSTAHPSQGYSVDQYGNFTHNGNVTTDYFHLNSNDGASKFLVYWETGDVRLASGTITINGGNLYLRTTGSSSDDSGDIGWFYGTGQEKMRIWAENEYTEKSGPRFRMYKKDGTALFSGSLSLSDHTHTYIIDPANSAYKLALKWAGSATVDTATSLCAWTDQSGLTKVIQDFPFDRAKRKLSSTLPSIKYKDVTVTDITMNANGYLKFPDASKPSAPSGYTLMFVLPRDWGRWSPNGDDRWGILSDGSYVLGPPSKTANKLITRWYYILTENMAAG